MVEPDASMTLRGKLSYLFSMILEYIILENSISQFFRYEDENQVNFKMIGATFIFMSFGRDYEKLREKTIIAREYLYYYKE